MLKDVFLTSLIGLPIALPLGMATFGVIRCCLKRYERTVRFVCVLVLLALVVGMAYGFLRFSGMILFPNDNTISFNWFSASWRDDGFRYLYGCSTFAVGIAAALHYSKEKTYD